MLRSSRSRLTPGEGQALLRTAFGDGAGPASRGPRPGPARPSLTPSAGQSGCIGTGASVPSAPASFITRASFAQLASASTPASTGSALLSPLGSFAAQHSRLPLSSVTQLLPRSFASQAAAAATSSSNPLKHAVLRSTHPCSTLLASSPSSAASSGLFHSSSPFLTRSSRLFSSSSSASSAPPSGFLAWYLSFLDSHPVITKALTACTIFTVADVTSQYLTYILDELPAQASGNSLAPAAGADSLALAAPGFQWDPARTLRMGAAGLVLSGPTLHVWYGLMARWRPGRDASSIAQKMLAGTFLYGPVFNAAFFASNGALQGEGSREIAGRLKRDVLPTLVNGLMYWPFCDAFTYRYVPVHLQPLGTRLTGARSLHTGLSGVGASTSHSAGGSQQQQQEEYVPRGSQGGADVAAGGAGDLQGRGRGGGSWSLAQTCQQLSWLSGRTVSSAAEFCGPVTPLNQGSPFARFQPAAAMSTACHGSAPLAASNRYELHPSQSSRPHSGLSPFQQPRASLWTAQQRLPQPSVGLRGVPVSFGAAALEEEMRGSVLGPAWAGAGRGARGFVQLRTILNVADNSGAKRVMCIKVLKGAKPNAAVIGDIIIASVRDADFHGKVKKGEVVTCVVVRSAMAKRRADGSMVRFDGPAAVVINKAGEPLGTRVFGPVPHELRRKKLVKVLALAQLVT